MVIARGMRPTLKVSFRSFWNPSFSTRMATVNKPPYAVRLLPSKSYGVEAPILLGSGITRSAPCGTRLSSLCSLLRLTIWVTPRSRLAKLELRGLSVLQQDFRGPQVVLSFSPSYSTQRPCIGQVKHRVLLCLRDAEIRTGAAGNRPATLPLPLLSSKGNYESWASRTRPVPVRFNYRRGVHKTRIATTSRPGCS